MTNFLEFSTRSTYVNAYAVAADRRRTRERFRAGQLQPVVGSTLRFPCGHERVWPAQDMPVRVEGVYLFDCGECWWRFYLFVHGPNIHDEAIMCEWDTESRQLTNRDALPVRGHRLPAITL
jgi:hypothetical protein